MLTLHKYYRLPGVHETEPELVQPAGFYNKTPIFRFERIPDLKAGKEFFREYEHVCFAASGIYLVLIFTIRFFMQSRKPLNLKWLLFAWNLSLSIFSVAGALRFVPEMFHVYSRMGFQYSACSPSYTWTTVPAFWAQMFTFSKLLELFDTFFLVLRKRKLIFLHWYHHITVFIYTWLAAPYSIGPGRYYIGVNYLVHAMMYPYFTFRAYGIKLPKSVSMFITMAQIFQMFFGIFITIYAAVTKFRGIPCFFPDFHIKYGLLMYASYLILFINFFYRSYYASSSTKFKKSK